MCIISRNYSAGSLPQTHHYDKLILSSMPDNNTHLDSQDERCSCSELDEVRRLRAALERKSELLQEQIRMGIRKDASIRELEEDINILTKKSSF